jgi:hypothetical protein
LYDGIGNAGLVTPTTSGETHAKITILQLGGVVLKRLSRPPLDHKE